MFREVKHPISDRRIPAGYEVTYHENRGYDSPDRWFEAREGRRKIGINYGYKDDAIEACVEDARKLPRRVFRADTVLPRLLDHRWETRRMKLIDEVVLPALSCTAAAALLALLLF